MRIVVTHEEWPSPETAQGALQRLDVNGDGFPSRAEAEATLASIPSASFDASDINRDGFLSRTEAEPMLRGRVAESRYPGPMPSFDRLDVDRDGFLTRTEAAPIANAPTFDRFDTNRDGFLSRAEADFLLRSPVGGTDASYGGTVYGPR